MADGGNPAMGNTVEYAKEVIICFSQIL
jgi:hypothetical protein